MKRNITLTIVILMGIFCAWNYLSAELVSENQTSPQSGLLEINEPVQADFEHCVKRATDFFESMSADQTQMNLAVFELFGALELTPELFDMSSQSTHIKSAITYGHPELIFKKSTGKNIIVLSYHYHTDKWPVFFHFVFIRSLDQNGELQQWRCFRCNFESSADRFVPSFM